MTSQLEDYQAVHKAASLIERGPTRDAVFDVLGQAEDNMRDGVEYESEQYCADFMANVRCNLCDYVGGEKAAKWFRRNGVNF
jgi:hypothetical protein